MRTSLGCILTFLLIAFSCRADARSFVISRSKKVAHILYQMVADMGNEEARLILDKW